MTEEKPNLKVFAYLTQFLNNNMRPVKAVGRRQGLAELLGGWWEWKSTPGEHKLPWPPVHLRLERYLKSYILKLDPEQHIEVTYHL